MFDLPAPAHLLDDELGVHPDLDVGVRGEVGRGTQPGDQALVLGDVVGRPADRARPLGQDRTGVGVADERPVPRRARIAP